MPRTTNIQQEDDLYEFIKKNYTIQREPFLNLLKVVNYSLETMRKPHLMKVVIYLPKGEARISEALEELQRLYKLDGCPPFLYHWAKEFIEDSTHDGLHFHLVLIGEARDKSGVEYNVWGRMNVNLHKLRERGWIHSFDPSEPWSTSMKPHSLMGCCSCPSRRADLINWLSYNCKAETKEGLTRCYGSSQVPTSVEPLKLPQLVTTVAA